MEDLEGSEGSRTGQRGKLNRNVVVRAHNKTHKELQSWAGLQRDHTDWPLYLHINQTLGTGCPLKEAITLGDTGPLG